MARSDNANKKHHPLNSMRRNWRRQICIFMNGIRVIFLAPTAWCVVSTNSFFFQRSACVFAKPTLSSASVVSLGDKRLNDFSLTSVPLALKKRASLKTGVGCQGILFIYNVSAQVIFSG